MLVRRFKPGQVVVDAMCGVGPFVIPAAMKGCKGKVHCCQGQTGCINISASMDL